MELARSWSPGQCTQCIQSTFTDKLYFVALTQCYSAAEPILGPHSASEECGAGHAMEVFQGGNLQQLPVECHSNHCLSGHLHRVCAVGQQADSSKGFHIPFPVLGKSLSYWPLQSFSLCLFLHTCGYFTMYVLLGNKLTAAKASTLCLPTVGEP